ncbi:hypothetical protein [Streptomyces antarcticus]|uniref:hypothetical protein n=1 Tax=Streptomyces antarcticus TaxID=2996458 RepID=UPI002270646A|nr:hypothetical protein [Streptomyces sp. H34-AA3]MCY0947858.1 hypothetical protein [Streptomyces sp. H34-AA3]
MAIVAGTAASVWTVEASVRDAVGRSRVEAGGVVEGVTAWGETMPPRDAAEDGTARVEVRASLFVQPAELVAALMDCEGAWTTPGVLESDDMARYYVWSSLMIWGGPGSPRMEELVAEVYGSDTDKPEFEAARLVVNRVFGVMAPAALAVAA